MGASLCLWMTQCGCEPLVNRSKFDAPHHPEPQVQIQRYMEAFVEWTGRLLRGPSENAGRLHEAVTVQPATERVEAECSGLLVNEHAPPKIHYARLPNEGTRVRI